jgi:transcription elongation factor GreA
MSDMNNIPFTKEGYEKLQDEHALLIVKREQVLDRLQKAREMGDLSENGAYKAARFELSSIDSRIRRVNRLLQFGEIVEAAKEDVVGIGTSVRVHDGKSAIEFFIVGGYESDPIKRKISINSPIGRALMGKKSGDTVVIEVSAGKITYKIEKISVL